jgi:hypothetical protein
LTIKQGPGGDDANVSPGSAMHAALFGEMVALIGPSSPAPQPVQMSRPRRPNCADFGTYIFRSSTPADHDLFFHPGARRVWVAQQVEDGNR